MYATVRRYEGVSDPSEVARLVVEAESAQRRARALTCLGS